MGAEAKVKWRRLGANEVVRSHPLALSPSSSRRFLLPYRRPHRVVLHAAELIGTPAKGVGSLVG
uniref:Uncharacterized protein n=1 Tax=Oryza nivara TaxID=4536 RepID=A0A0E0FPU3_ORYNI